MSYIFNGQFGEVKKSPDEILISAKKAEKQKRIFDLATSPIKTLAREAIGAVNGKISDEEKIMAIVEKCLMKHGLI